jgi:hypothetical protein
MQLYLAMGQMRHLCERRDIELSEKEQPEEQNFYRNASACFRAASEIMRFLPAEQQQGLYYERQRLETQFGLTLACLRDFERAHQRLNEAQSMLAMSPRISKTVEAAIIELHRAEVFTQQAMFHSSSSEDDEPSALARIRNGILDALDDGEGVPPFECVEDVAGLARSGEDTLNDLRSNVDCLDQAWACLLRAEELLGTQRKNVWWVTWFFELKIKVIELKLVTAFTEPEKPVPVVDLPYTPQFCPAECDRLMYDACRMVRLDVYRLARIVESYARSLGVLTTFCDVAPKAADRLKHRETAMQRTCSRAVNELEARNSRRMKSDEPPLDPDVGRYVDYVIESAKGIAHWSRCASGRDEVD